MQLHSGTHRILIVDDDPGIRLLMRTALKDSDFLIHECDDGEAAIAAFFTFKPDVTLLDVTMPGMNGFDCCREIRRRPSGLDCAIVMVTSLDKPKDIELAFEAGATDFMTKPLNWQLFNHRVRYLLQANTNLLELKSNQKKLARAQSIAKLGYWEHHFDSREIAISDEVCRILELPAQSRPGYRQLLKLIHPQDRPRLKTALRTLVKDLQPYDIEYKVRLPTGAVKTLNDRGEISFDQGVASLTGTVHDISARKNFEKKITYYAYYDSLTNLPNRKAFIRQLESALINARQSQQALSLLHLNMDRFKLVNETYSHEVADKILHRIANRLKKCLRLEERGNLVGPGALATVARMTGDEFAVLLTDSGAGTDPSAVARRLLEECARPFVVQDFEIYLTCSIGIALYPSDGSDAQTLLRHANMAMHHAKQSGSNDFRFFTNKLQNTGLSKLGLESDMRRALKHNEFVLHYQPQFDHTRKLTGFEALVRWQHPEKGLLAPGHFIHIAESSGLIVPMGTMILEEACLQAVKWQGDTNQTFVMGVNISALQFNSTLLPDLVARALDRSGLAPQLLELEITESAIIRDIDETFELMMKLKSMGVKLAIDDFGTGYSSLNYLKNFPIDTLKIDKSFIDDIASHSKEAAIVRTILQLAQNLGIDSIAEGVETENQAELLMAMNCYKFQGYYFSKPLPAEKVFDFISNHGKSTERKTVTPLSEH